ncbi:MAG: hypothetical protein COB67_02595 [SAR324 cluster bacterium]|uniref:Uncharacterized protein n=1 Tax=SAR324 cluster bacterium TaxID=2024889 RepID=A0A2A4T9Z7_9DELT|nr:MAG: hypothetical protein COB67_02595 [SAR324 cluster bacterium]
MKKIIGPIIATLVIVSMWAIFFTTPGAMNEITNSLGIAAMPFLMVSIFISVTFIFTVAKMGSAADQENNTHQ